MIVALFCSRPFVTAPGDLAPCLITGTVKSLVDYWDGRHMPSVQEEVRGAAKGLADAGLAEYSPLRADF